MDKTPLSVFLLIRAELEVLAGLVELLRQVCCDSSPLERRLPRDPFTAIPIRQDLSSPIRPLKGCFEQADYQRLCQALEQLSDFLNKFMQV